MNKYDYTDNQLLSRIVESMILESGIDYTDEDREYFDAIERGDMEMASRMVRDAAARAMRGTHVVDEDGMPRVVYHGTYQNGEGGRPFSQFRPKADTGGGGFELYFTDKSGVASFFAGAPRMIRFDSPMKQFQRINKTNVKAILAFMKEFGDGIKSIGIENHPDKDGSFYRLNIEYNSGASTSSPLGNENEFVEELYEQAKNVAEDAELAFGGEHYEYSSYTGESEKRKIKGGTYGVYLNVGNPLVVDAGGGLFDDFAHDGKKTNVLSLSRYAMENGHDGVILKNVHETTYNPSNANLCTDYIVFSSTQVKSSNAITCDDSGDIIPLSQRFDFSNPDIRW